MHVDNEKYCQIGWDNNDKFIIYYVDKNDPPTKQVCQFDEDKIIGISETTHEIDVASK